MVMGVKTKRLVRLKAEAESKKPSWYLSATEEELHGCKYPNNPADTARHIPTIVKYAGNILLLKIPELMPRKILEHDDAAYEGGPESGAECDGETEQMCQL
ncbi:hypothetical protein TB2_022544 [Malus domestica]